MNAPFPRRDATEAQAEAAIRKLKAAIDAAENSNQAGENAVVLYAAAPQLFDALEGLMPTNVGRLPSTMPDKSVLPLDVTFGELRRAMAALAKAAGELE